MTDSVTFLASFPDVLAQMKIGKDGMRVQLEIPESEMANAIGLLTMRGQVLEVTVKVVLQNREDQDNAEASMATRAKRKSRWKTAEE